MNPETMLRRLDQRDGKWMGVCCRCRPKSSSLLRSASSELLGSAGGESGWLTGWPRRRKERRAVAAGSQSESRWEAGREGGGRKFG